MTYSLLYWILMLFWLVFGLWSSYPVAGTPWRPQMIGGTLLQFVLFVLIGVKLFGAPLHS